MGQLRARRDWARRAGGAGHRRYVGYDYLVSTRANRSGDAFSQALNLAHDGKNDEALAALDQLEKDGHGAYPVLARLRAATVLADKGDTDGAVQAFDAVSADNSCLSRSATLPGCAPHPAGQR